MVTIRIYFLSCPVKNSWFVYTLDFGGIGSASIFSGIGKEVLILSAYCTTIISLLRLYYSNYSHYIAVLWLVFKLNNWFGMINVYFRFIRLRLLLCCLFYWWEAGQISGENEGNGKLASGNLVSIGKKHLVMQDGSHMMFVVCGRSW